MTESFQTMKCDVMLRVFEFCTAGKDNVKLAAELGKQFCDTPTHVVCEGDNCDSGESAVRVKPTVTLTVLISVSPCE
jgi:hypothetical protein